MSSDQHVLVVTQEGRGTLNSRCPPRAIMSQVARALTTLTGLVGPDDKHRNRYNSRKCWEPQVFAPLLNDHVLLHHVCGGKVRGWPHQGGAEDNCHISHRYPINIFIAGYFLKIFEKVDRSCMIGCWKLCDHVFQSVNHSLFPWQIHST